MRKSISIYKYIHNESLDLCEIENIRTLVISQLLCNELKFQNPYSSELSFKRYLKENEFLKSSVFDVFLILSQLCNSKVFKDGWLPHDNGIFWKMNIKNSLFWEWKNNFVFSDSDLFSVLRVLLLITVNMDHPVSIAAAIYG